MKPVQQLVLSLLPLLAFGGCMGGPIDAHPQPGSISLKEDHAFIPTDNGIAQIQNLKAPGKPVFLFGNVKVLGQCYTALEEGKSIQETCDPAIIAKVKDGLRVRTLNCHSSDIAACEIETIDNDGEQQPARGAIMWDWLKPVEKVQK